MNRYLGVLPLVLLLMISLCCLQEATAAKLDASEVGALRKIAKALGKKDWDFTQDPCRGDGKGNWIRYGRPKGFESNVSCECASNSSTCHVVRMALKAENLMGTLSPEFAKLRFLKSLDLSRNCLTGGIPKEWAAMNLEDLSFMGNRMSGQFPMALTSITTLINMSIEGNAFSGKIPPEIGKMKNLEKFVMSSNNFTGQLPDELFELTKLKDLRISDNFFSGKIPDSVSNLTLLEKLQITGSNLEGPIPSSISSLTKLNDLRIVDLKGQGSTFPELGKMESLKTLVLRRCSIHGEIPEYLGRLQKLKTIDLSFNNLSGVIPPTFDRWSTFDFLYLTGNKLNGTLPSWIQETTKIVDLSDNNLTPDKSTLEGCPKASLNLVESFSASKVQPSSINACLRSGYGCTLPEKQYRSSLYINCGGNRATISRNTYEADLEPKGSSTFYEGNGWAFSSTGNFMDDNTTSDGYVKRNSSALKSTSHDDVVLYTTARASALSLTYYGLCLFNGSYTVTLHFAEIMFTNDNTFRSLGKRVFNVYIQDKLVLENFNIQKDAGGAGIPINKTFTANVTTTRTLKIHLYWAGRGTTGIPERGVYGPLISAITVKANFNPPIFRKSFPGKLVALLVVASVALLFSILVLSWRKGWLRGQATAEEELRGLDLLTGSFTLRQIKAATRNFDSTNKVGEGGFGSVYKGTLSDGTVIAVKQLSSKSKQGNRNNLLLVYEYMVNNCLSRALFGKDEAFRLKLDWPTRQRICLGIARGLAYLHEESRLKIVHRDIKTSNVLLDKDLNAKISDFGLAKLNEDDQSHISTRVAGTIGYMAPEYAMRGYLTDKADVYSFGVVALEIVSGKSNTNYRPMDDFVNLLDWAYVLQERGSLLELVDPNLDSNFSSEEAMIMINIAMLCTNVSPTLRPTMSQVVSMMERRTAVQDLLSDHGIAAANAKYRTIRNHLWQNPSPGQSQGVLSMHSRCSCFCTSTEESQQLIRRSSREPRNDEDE
ncbi:hypothetical protein MLD38_030586 [Melastoma candidum]|uniref:Uncharacterized protein n=1 Tax=Melastoma candidum TaxID=119954 RepID=A0ACB9MNA7_9MYRT|nr:hypothetical protein MLD38_030586 [Melastoma candidum]